MKLFLSLLLLLPTLAFASVSSFPMTFHASLSTENEIAGSAPGTPANASGEAAFVYIPLAGMLYFSVDYRNLSGAVTMSYFHDAASGSNGPVLQTICESSASTLLGACSSLSHGEFKGAWKMSDAQIKELESGKIYVNIHTLLNPGGEVRGQLVLGPQRKRG